MQTNDRVLVNVGRTKPTSLRDLLIFFPCAAGDIQSIRPWLQQFESDWECVAAQYSGRGRRINEAAPESIDRMASEIYQALEGRLSSVGRLCFLGHSMGAWVALGVADLLVAAGLEPSAFIVIAAPVPPADNEALVAIPASDAEIEKILVERGGTPPEVLNNAMMRQIIFPIARTDLSNTARHIRVPPPGRFKFPIIASYGQDDTLVGEFEVRRWGDLTKGEFTSVATRGGHFAVANNLAVRLEKALDT